MKLIYTEGTITELQIVLHQTFFYLDKTEYAIKHAGNINIFALFRVSPKVCVFLYKSIGGSVQQQVYIGLRCPRCPSLRKNVTGDDATRNQATPRLVNIQQPLGETL